MQMELKVGSLFSGIGGIDLGFLKAGFNVSWAIENDAACCRTYRHSFGDINLIEKDIRFVEPSQLDHIDVLIAGFPCQAFSVGGLQRGFDDCRGNLFFEITKFVEYNKPRFVFLENVPNLIEHDSGRTFNHIHNAFSELNYTIRYRVMRASEYGGIPQIRDRIYIVAFREDRDCEKFSFPEEIERVISIEDILQRNVQKHNVYYYDIEDPFYSKVNNIVFRKDSIYRVYHESIKITQNQMCPTLTASMGTRPNQVHLVIDDFGIRRLTLRECLDFQGFPNNFYFPNTITINDAYKQIGNSVCVPVVERIAKNIKLLRDK